MKSVLALVFCIASVRAAASFAAAAAAVQRASVQIPDGDYNIQAADGNFFQQFVDDAQNFFVGKGSNVATVTLEQGDQGGEIFHYSNGKCAAAQWVQAEANNGFAATYACGEKSTHTVRPAKFEWYLVPASGSASSSIAAATSSSDDSSDNTDNKTFNSKVVKTASKVAVSNDDSSSSSSDSSACPKSKAFVDRHPEYAQKWPGCAKLRARSTEGKVVKRAAKYGPFAIVASDHIMDRPTRAMTSNAGSAFAGQKSSVLNNFDLSSSAQQFYFIPA